LISTQAATCSDSMSRRSSIPAPVSTQPRKPATYGRDFVILGTTWFYRPDMKLALPVYLDNEVQSRPSNLAAAKGVEISDLVNDLLKKDLESIETATELPDSQTQTVSSTSRSSFLDSFLGTDPASSARQAWPGRLGGEARGCFPRRSHHARQGQPRSALRFDHRRRPAARSGISSEVERALRDMTGLTVRRPQEKDGCQSPWQLHGNYPANNGRRQASASRRQCPERPPCFSSSRTLSMVMPRSTALHMS